MFVFRTVQHVTSIDKAMVRVTHRVVDDESEFKKKPESYGMRAERAARHRFPDSQYVPEFGASAERKRSRTTKPPKKGVGKAAKKNGPKRGRGTSVWPTAR